MPEIADIQPAHFLDDRVVGEKYRHENQKIFFRPGLVRVFGKPVTGNHRSSIVKIIFSSAHPTVFPRGAHILSCKNISLKLFL
jgi:hypothetical protein